MDWRSRFFAALLTAAAAWGPSSAFAQTPAPVTAMLRFERTSLYVDERMPLVLVVKSRGVNLSRDLSLSGLPDPARLQFSEFREFPIERAQVGGVIEETRKFECDVRPRSAGQYQVAPRLRVAILVRRGLLIGSTLVETSHEVAVAPVTLTVRELPERERPADFTGLVGRYEFDVSLHPTNVVAGELVTASLRVAGRGYLDRLAAPRLSPGRHFKAYDPKPVAGGGDQERRFEQVLVPQSTNACQIPPVALAFFDPEAGAYRRVVRGPFFLRFHPPQEDAVPRERFLPRTPAGTSGTRTPTEADTVRVPRPGRGATLVLFGFGVLYVAAAAAFLARFALRGRRRVIKSAVVVAIAVALAAPCRLAIKATVLRAPEAHAARDTPARFAPSAGALETFRIPGGAAVDIVGTHGAWLKVECAGNRGWIPADAVK